MQGDAASLDAVLLESLLVAPVDQFRNGAGQSQTALVVLLLTRYETAELGRGKGEVGITDPEWEGETGGE